MFEAAVNQFDAALAEPGTATGTYIKGGSYGSDLNLPIPQEEGNNPNSDGCLNRNA
jgi:hypothetical protein